MARCRFLRFAGRVSLYPLLACTTAFTLYNLFAGQSHGSLLYANKGNLTVDTEKQEDTNSDDEKAELDLSQIQNLLRRFDKQLTKHDQLLDLKLSRSARNPQESGNIEGNVARGSKSPATIMPLLDFSKSSKARRTGFKPESFNDSIVFGDNHKLASPPLMPDPYYKESSCPKTISSIAKYSTWFKERFRPWVKLFVDDEDVENEDNFRRLSRHGLPFGFGGTTREEMLKIMHFDNFTNAPVNRPQKCIRCAVVGNGGVLNGSYAGNEIDSHDLIFRLNYIRNEERYTRDIGKKTSFYLFYPESQHVHQVRDPNAVFLFAAFKGIDVIYFEHMVMGTSPFIIKNSKGVNVTRHTARTNPTRIKLLHPDFLRYVFVNYLDAKKARPTTGAMLALLGIHLCDEVDIYGFGYDPRFTIHYYDKRFVTHTNASTGCHDVFNERALWKKLHDEGVVRFFKRDI